MTTDQVTTLQSKSSVRVDGQVIHVDPEFLFQRFIVASNAIDNRKALFRFELCSYPSALFDDSLMLRAPQKAILANAIWTRLPPDIAGPTGEVQHVLDGGALLHRIAWPHGFPTYRGICTLYCDYVSRYFGHAIVVFDGYRNPSTKYTTHQRRTGGKIGIEVTFTEDMKLTISMASTCSCSVLQRRRTESGTSRPLKMSWVLTSAITSSSYTRYLGATPHPEYMVS